MTDTNDPMAEIRASFFIECEELLEALQDGLQQLDDGSDDPETINVVFRAVHSIKGGAGAFGLEDLVRFAHRYETVLDDVRSGKLNADGDPLKVFFQAADHLSDLVRMCRDDAPIDHATSDELIAALNEFLGEEGEEVTAEDFQPLGVAMTLDLPDLDLPDEAPEAATPTYKIHFKPNQELFATGNEPQTLLRNLCGLLPPDIGAVSFGGHDIYGASPQLLHHMRLRTGLSFQGGALLGSLSVLENVALPLRENTDLPESVILDTARMKLDMVGLLHAAELLPSSLSGGMLKRAAIARAIALDPEIVYFDEPSAGLDPITAAEVDNVIVKLNKVFGITMVVVTHDLPSAHAIADRIVVLLDGRIAALGERDRVWNDPNPRLRDFIERRLPAEDGGGMDIISHIEV